MSIINQVLRQAGDNRPELEAVLAHYADEPEKLAAARYLIANLPAHYSYADSDAIHEVILRNHRREAS